MIKVYTISADEELINKADEMAKKQYVPTRSEFVRLAIRHYLKYLKRTNNN